MFHNRTFKVLSNLAFLMVFVTGQVGAAPNNRANMINKDSSLLASSPSVIKEDSVLPIELEQETELIPPAETIRISGEAGGDNPSISMDGHYIAFESSGEIYVHDLLTGTNTLIGAGEDPYISATGRYTVFVQGSGIFIWDMEEENEENMTNFVANGSEPSVSADGRYVAFKLSGVIYFHDFINGTTSRISINSVVNQCKDSSPSISADGHYVIFYRGGGGFVYPCNNTYSLFGAVLVYDILNNTTTPVSTYTFSPSISTDGRYVTFLDQCCDDDLSMYYIKVHDRYTNNTSSIFNADFGNVARDPASISADGRYVAYGDYDGRAHVYEMGITNHTTEVSIALDGTHGNGWASDVSISADGQYAVFTSTSTNLVDGDTNGTVDVFVRGVVHKKPPLILVHGWQGLNLNPGGGFHYSDDGDVSNDIELYNATANNSTLNFDKKPGDEDRRNIADMFVEQGFEVWIAHLETSFFNTPKLHVNGEYLSDQIKYVASQNPNPITIVAHSMGGLVSRNAIRLVEPAIDIKALYTFGSPHAGIPVDILLLMVEGTTTALGYPGVGATTYAYLCGWQPGACQMTFSGAMGFNKENHNIGTVQYNFIGGQGGDSGLAYLWGYAGGFAPNDGFAGMYSGVGWVHPSQTFLPNNWPNASLPGQYITNETHPAGSNRFKAYYVAQDDNPRGEDNKPLYSDTFLCIQALMNGETPNSFDTCWQAEQSSVYITPTVAITDLIYGYLETNESETISLPMDGASRSSISIVWSGGEAPIFTLINPTGEIINPAYAIEHPEQVSYEIGEGSPESSPYASYHFVAGQIGIWQLNITAADAINYHVFGSLEDSNRTLSASTDLDTYQIGDTATITATLENDGVGLPGTTITAILSRPDEVSDTISLTDPENDGTYTAIYTIPNAPGFMPIEIKASGDDNGIAFTRQKTLMVMIAPNDLTLTGDYADVPNDDNADGFYEHLDFNVEVNADATSKYEISAELYAGNQLITHAADVYPLNAGTQTITLRFDGSAIREEGLDGPYTIKNLYATSLDVGIPAISVQDVPIYTTGVYTYTQFGAHACYLLTLSHGGAGADPTAVPTKSDGCYVNEYEPGKLINLTAFPAAGMNVSGWSGTIADNSNSTTNVALMPANPHTVSVNYGDSSAPTVDTFTTPPTSSNLNIPITAFTASDNTGVTAYMITESATRPLAGDADWSVTIPSTYTVGANGSYTLYPWVKDAAGNVSVVFASPSNVIVDTRAPWNTFLGGSGGDNGYELVSDGNGNFYVMGISDASWGDPIRAYSGSREVFVAKIDASGALIWNTFLGGEGYETYGTHNLSVDALGNIYVSGYADSTWGNPLQPHNGGAEVFVAKLNSSGTLVWNTFLGGSGEDVSTGIVVDVGQNVYVTGQSNATWGNPVENYTSSDLDGFVAKLDPAGMLVWNTFTGGSGTEVNFGISLDQSNNIYIYGRSSATWGNPLHAHSTGNEDAHVAKLNTSGTLIWNTFLGGTARDLFYDMAIGEGGDLYLTGSSVAAWGDPILAYSAGQDGLVVKLNSSGTFVWNTFFGGSGTDYGYSILLDEDGNVNIAGGSNAAWGNPLRAYTIGSDPSDPNINFDATFVKLNSSGGLRANTFLGGSELDKGYGIALEGGGNIYLAGYSNATWDDPLRAYTSGYDGFAAKFNLDDAPLVVSSITRNDANPTSATDVNFTVIFSEPVTDLDVDDFSLTTNGISDASVIEVRGLGTTYTVTVNTGSYSSGTIRLDVVDDDSVIDAASNPLNGPGTSNDFTSGQTFTIDKTSPVVISSTRADANPTSAASVDFTVTFSEPVIGVDAGDFALISSGVSDAIISAVNGSGAIYTVSVNTGADNGTIHLDIVDNDTILDGFNNPLGGVYAGNGDFTDGETYTIDKAPFVLSSVRADPNPTNAASVNFIVTFSEPVNGVDTSDFALETTGAVVGTNISDVSGSGAIYVVEVTINASSRSGTLRLDVMDDATIVGDASNPLIAGFTSGETYTIDRNGPTVLSSVRADTNPTSAATVDFTVTFSEPVNGVTTDDFSLTTSGVSDAAVSGVSGSGSIYTVTVSTGTGSGTIRLNVLDDDETMITDDVSNPISNGIFDGEIYTIEKTGPTVLSSLRDNPNPTSAASVNFTVTFSESVTGVDVGDFNLTTSGISGATVTGVNGSDSSYIVTVSTGTGNGSIRLDVLDNDSIVDILSNSLDGDFTTGEIYDVNKGNPAPPSKPTLVSPGNNSLTTDYTPLLNWNNSTIPAGTIFDHYQIQITDDSSFTSIVLEENVNGISNSDYTVLNDLASNTKFYWRVRAFNAYGNSSAWSNVRNFDTALLPPTLITPNDAEQMLINRPTFDWDDVPGAADYRIQISNNVDFTGNLTNANVTSSTYTRASDLPFGAILYWRVRSDGVNGPSAWSEVRSLITTNPPSVPTLAAPRNNAKVSGPSPLLDWNDSTLPAGIDFDYYQIQVATESAFTTIVHDNNVPDITNSQDNTAVLSPATTYYWRVRAFNTLGHSSEWSNVRSIRIKFAGPALTLPASDSTVATRKPTFTWDAVSGATNYTIQVSLNSAFSPLAINKTVTSPTYTHTANLQAGTTYYWRVRVKSPTTYGPGDWSEIFTFTTP